MTRKLPHATTIPSQLDGAESCGPNQKWDPNYVFQGIKGQCVPASQPLVQMAAPSFWSNFMSAFGPPTGAPTGRPPTAPTPMPASRGMSQNTMIAIGLGVVGLALLLVATRK